MFGPGAVLTARLPLSDTGANTADPHLCDAYTGPIMAIADQTPVICSAGVASPCGLDLLGAAGVPVSREIRTYRTTEDFHRLVGDVLADGERLLCQHVHDEGEVPADACMVAPPLLRYLNNKANLPAIVGPDGAPGRTSISSRGRRHAPRRRVVGAQGLLRRLLRRRIRGVRPPGGDARSPSPPSCSRAPS